MALLQKPTFAQRLKAIEQALLHHQQPPAAAAPVSFYDWAATYHRTFKGRSLRFDGLPWLQALYQDSQPSLVVKKSVQLGCTEYLIARSFYLCERGSMGCT